MADQSPSSAGQFVQDVETAISVMRNIAETPAIDVATAPRETVWEDGKVKLYHFKREGRAKARIPVLVVYALVNRWEMMDLQPDRSFLRKMLSEGMDVYLIDWGIPTRLDRCKTLEDYILGNIGDCADFICKSCGVPSINLLGVCQGGTFCVIYSALFPEKVKNLVTIVTPVNFDPGDGLLFKWAKLMDFDAMVDGFHGLIPGDFLNWGFDLLKPMIKTRKYLALPETITDKDKFMNFLRLEQWVADSPPQAGEAFRQFATDLYQKNLLVKGEFRLGGRAVDLKNITMPLLNIYARDDHILPPDTVLPLNDLVGSKDKKLIEFPGGHIGVFVGTRSQELLPPAVAKWLMERDE